MAADAPSPSWYRVAGLRPRLRSHARINRHVYRGRVWYVIEDRVSRRSHRLNPEAYYVAGLMDGRRSLQEIWDAAARRFGDDAPTQDEVIRLLGQLHFADILQCEVTPDVDELLRRAHRVSRRTWIATVLSPLAIRFPLFDPDRFLERWLPWYRPLFGAGGALVWLLVVGWGVALAAQHWGELSRDVTDRVLAPENLLIVGLVFPLLKGLHELGHACAVKAWGGEVHELGIMLLVLMPIPYVDASAASAFPEKPRRVMVGAAGMAVELFIAAIAMFLWVEAEPGLVRAVLYNVMLIAGISTVLFNANPLLRFDGYYMLCDVIGIPNLRQRSGQYLAAALERRLFGTRPPPVEAAPRERAWLVFFAIASFLYRLFITFSIAVFIAGKYLLAGVVLAIWVVAASVVLPLARLAGFVAFSPRLRRQRARAVIASTAVAAALALAVFVLPLPLWTNVEGVVWVPEKAVVRAGADGFVQRVLAQPGTPVRAGEVLLEAEDPALPFEIRALEARRQELAARHQAERVESVVRAQITLEELRAVDADLARARERAGELTVRSPADGVFVLAAAQDLPQRFVRHGEQMGYVLPSAAATVRVLVPQDRIDLVRNRTRGVSVKLAERLDRTFAASIRREVPGASDRVPSLALSSAGGGAVALDPLSREHPRALQTHFEFELELPGVNPTGIGGRVFVRFEHGREPLAQQAYRVLRQLFLQRFAV
jgi:putative peptide zinc metalloprotease protein